MGIAFKLFITPFIFQLFLLCCKFCFTDSLYTVTTEYGKIRGHPVTVHTGEQVVSFLGVPYARPPVKALRWRPPQPPEPWHGIYNASQIKPLCIQAKGSLELTHPDFDATFSEDCLYLNLYKPTDNSKGPYAVMIWIHGGGYGGGANIQYPGHFLASRDVIVVIPNFRQNIIGYLSTGDDAAPGNYGLLDQHAVMKFVKRNIHAFNGDPNRVTLFGQSSGASSIGLHIVSPKTKGSFHRAIQESGSEASFWAMYWPEQDPANYTRQVAEKVNCLRDNSYEMVDCLREIDAERLRTISYKCKPGFMCRNFSPVVDGPGNYLPKPPQLLRRTGDFSPVDVLSGVTSEDGSLYSIALVPETLSGGLNKTHYRHLMRTKLLGIFSAQFPEREQDVYEAFKFFYTHWPDTDDEELNCNSTVNIVTDVSFSIPMDWCAKMHSRKGNVYIYELGMISQFLLDILPKFIGTPHNGELPYVWGYPLLKKAPEVREDSKINFDIVDWTEEDARFVRYVQNLWTNFAKYGNPTPFPVQTAEKNNFIVWPKFSEKEQNYLHINRKSERRLNYNARGVAFYGFLRYLTGIDYPGQLETRLDAAQLHDMAQSSINKLLKRFK